MAKGYIIDNGVIVIQRDLTELDIFVKDFLDVLKKHSSYLVVSGYVSICTGRTRGTEDVDILIPKMGKEEFGSLFNDLQKNNFWCYQGDSASSVYSYIENLNSVRFARTDQIFPNIECIPFDETKKAKSFEFSHPLNIRVQDFQFNIPPIEFEILYKEIILKGKKDLEDATHLRTFFSDIVKKDKFKAYKAVIKQELQ